MEKNKLYYIGSFGETVELGESTNDLVKKAELFSTGTHRGVDYTDEDLQTLVDNFSKEDEIPLQYDHSDSALATVGYLDSVEMKDGKLLGEVRVIDDNAKNRVGRKLNKKLSISFYLKETEAGLKPFKIREVSLVAFPQVQSARLFSENGYVSDYEAKPEGGKEKMSEETKKQLEEQIRQEFAEKYGSVEEFAAMKAQVESFKKQEITNQVEKFAADSKIVPAQKETLTSLMESFSKEQKELFEKFMEEQVKADFQEQGEIGEEDHPEDKKVELSEDEKFYQEHVAMYGDKL